MTNFLEIRTPDGNALKFKGFADQGGETQWFRTRLTPGLLDARSKERCPIIGTLTAGPQRLIVLDLDPKSAAEAAWAEDLCLSLAERHENCLAFQSVSGNWKAGFLVTSEFIPSHETCEAYLMSMLPESAWDRFDRAGMTRLYVNTKLAGFLAKALPVTPAPALPEKVKVGSRYILTKPTQSCTYHQAQDSYLPTEDLPAAFQEGDRKALLKILTAAWHLASDQGWNLPLQELALNIGCSPSQVGRILKELAQEGLIVCIDHSFQQGVKAKTYKAKAALFRAIQAHKADYLLSGKPTKSLKELPNTILDGQFHKLCLQTLNRFNSQEAFAAYLQSLQGLTPKRLKEGLRYAKSHFGRTQAA